MATPRICSVEGCDKPAFKRGWCSMHYSRWYRSGSLDARHKAERRQPCSIDGCQRLQDSHGFCGMHVQRLKRHGSPTGGGTSFGESQQYFENVVLTYEGDECLIWKYGKQNTGYGMMQYGGRKHLVHRLVCQIINGDPPASNYDAAHSCGRRGCVAPRHLRWATRQENMADKLLHGTHHRGTRNRTAKLTEDQVREIRERFEAAGPDALADKLGVSRACICDAYFGRTWGWLD